jgi:hypothetical protein
MVDIRMADPTDENSNDEKLLDQDPIYTLLQTDDYGRYKILSHLLPTIDVIYTGKNSRNFIIKKTQTYMIHTKISKIDSLNIKRVKNPSSVKMDDIKNYLNAINDIMEILENPRDNGKVCTFLGNKSSDITGCKIRDPPADKLQEFSNIIKTLILEYLKGIDKKILEELQKDNNTMGQLTETIRSLIYFFGTKTISPIFSYFSDFFKELKNLFGDDIIVINCPGVSESYYTCGRMVDMIHCEETKKYKILIGRTESEYDNSVSINSYKSGDVPLYKQCGGKRKTRKTKKQYKRTVKRKQSKRR